jgi:PAS domain S-box-containing protein
MDRDGDPWQLLDYAQDKIAVVDENGVYRYANAAAERILGYDPETLVGENAFEYVHPEDHAETLAAFERVVEAADERVETATYRHRTADGSWVWLESRLSSDTDAAFGGYVVSSREVTQRVEAQRDRDVTQARLEELTETLSDVLWLFDSDWSEVLFVNEAYEDVYGAPTETLEGDPTAFLDATHPDDVPVVKRAMARLSRGEQVDVEYRVNEAEDYGVWVWVRGSPIVEDGDVVRIAGFSRDITSRRRRERQLAVMDNLLRHNLRNDVNVILGNADIVARAGDDDLAARAAVIQRTGRELLASADKQRTIIDVLTDADTPRPVDLVGAVTAAVETVTDAADDASVVLDAPDSAEVMALREIGLAVIELLDNAVTYDPGPDPEIRVSIGIDDGTVKLTIADACPPIPEEEHRVLTGDWEMDDMYHTTGLGLWLVYWIVDLSGGSISFRYDEPRGNVVTVSLQRPPTA